jgi:hypothetical protein
LINKQFLYILGVFLSIPIWDEEPINEIRIKIHPKTEELRFNLTEEDGFARRTKIY